MIFVLPCMITSQHKILLAPPPNLSLDIDIMQTQRLRGKNAEKDKSNSRRAEDATYLQLGGQNISALKTQLTRQCARSLLATMIHPLVYRSSRCTIPGRAAPAPTDESPPAPPPPATSPPPDSTGFPFWACAGGGLKFGLEKWCASALTMVPLGTPAHGCTVSPACVRESVSDWNDLVRSGGTVPG